MIKRLLEVSILKVGLAQLRIGRDQDKEILLVDVNQQLAEGKLLNANLDNAVGILRHCKFV